MAIIIIVKGYSIKEIITTGTCNYSLNWKFLTGPDNIFVSYNLFVVNNKNTKSDINKWFIGEGGWISKLLLSKTIKIQNNKKNRKMLSGR